MKISHSTSLLVSALLGLSPASAQAQIIPNEPLNPEAAQLIPLGPGETLIEGGAVRGQNLFHSFEAFNVPTQESVLFGDPGGIERVVGKVTGDSLSRIDGALGVRDVATGNLSSADLFLLNPNGVVLGPNFQSLVLGSLFLTSAERLQFEGYDFSAASTELPLPLLEIGVPVGLQMGQQPGAIVQEAPDFGAGLSVAPGQSLTLLGGEVELSGWAFSELTGGRLELGAVGPKEQVDWLPNDRGIALDYAQVNEFQDIRFSETLVAEPIAVANLEVVLQGRIITFDGAEFVAYAAEDQPGGDVEIRASEALLLTDVLSEQFESPSLLSTRVFFDATEPGGNILIEAPVVSVQGSSQIETFTRSSEEAGQVTIRSSESVTVSGTDASGLFSSLITSLVDFDATGQGGNILIETPLFSLEGGGQVVSQTFGSGAGGNIDIRAEQIDIIGTAGVESALSIFSDSSVISSRVSFGASGNGGQINLVGNRQVRLLAGGFIQTSSDGTGNAGNIRIQAEQLEIDNASNPLINFPTSVNSVVIDGTGQGGNVQIWADDLRLKDGALIASTTFGAGDTGQLEVNAFRIDLQGTDESAERPLVTGFLVTAEPGSSGNANSLQVNTDSLSLSNGATIQTNTFGPGQAATLEINAEESITLSGRDPQSGLSSSISSSTDTEYAESQGFPTPSGGQGGALSLTTPNLRLEEGAIIASKSQSDAPGGAINLDVNRLELLSGSQIQASAFNQGDSGTIAITATEAITITGQDPSFATQQVDPEIRPVRNSPESAESAIAARAFGSGSARQVRLQTPVLRVQDQGLVTVSSEGQGTAGNLTLDTRQVTLDGGSLEANTAIGPEGGISLRATDWLLLRRGGAITTNAGTDSTGGNIDIDANFIVAVPNEDSDIAANAVRGQGGRIEIQTEEILGLAFRDRPTLQSDITASSESGQQGTVTIQDNFGSPEPEEAELPDEPNDPNNQLIVGCLLDEDANFVVTGRGGIPANTSEVLNQSLIWQDPQNTTASHTSVRARQVQQQPFNNSARYTTPVVREAKAWGLNHKNQVELFAQTRSLDSGALLPAIKSSQTIQFNCDL